MNGDLFTDDLKKKRASNESFWLVGQPDVAYLLAATRALAFHPPSRATALAALDRYLSGEPLVLA